MSKKLNHIIIKKLNKQYARYLTQNNKWNLVVPHRRLKIKNDYVKIRFSKKHGTRSLRLTYPFRINKITAYMFGLILGSAVRRKDRLVLNVDPRQVPKILNFCKILKVTPRYKIIKKRYKSRGKNVYTRYFQNAVVFLPNVLYKYLKALGLNLYRPKIPRYFAPKFRHYVISGYLNSKKTTVIRYTTSPLNQVLQISAKSKGGRKNYAKKFIFQIHKDLKYHSIKAKIKHYKNLSIIRVNDRSFVRLMKKFHIRRPQIRYSGKFISLLLKYPHLQRTINLHNLNALQLSILEIAFYHFFTRKCHELEYSDLEDLFSCSSNRIRKCLYYFQELGLLQYFTKGKKEFIRPTLVCFKHAEDYLKYRLTTLKKATLKMDGEFVFICSECGRGIDYISAMDGKTFSCPNCESEHLKQYSGERLKRSISAQYGQLNQFRNSFEVMCYA